MTIMNSLLSFLFGADFEILQLCPKDFAEQRKRLFVSIVIAIVCAFSSGVIVSIFLFLFYTVFLSKASKAAFFKFVLTLAISTYIFLGLSYHIFNGITSLNQYNIEKNVIATILAVVTLVLCYIPVNFSGLSSTYDKLYKQKIANKEAQGKLLLEERASAENKIIKNREAARIKLEADISKYMSEKILKSQKSAIDKIAEKWHTKLEKEILINIDKFYNYDKVQAIKINKANEEELNNYISELLKDKRKEFAHIIVEKWAEEKKKELQNNPKAFI